MIASFDTSTPLVYDAGALVAADKGSRELLAIHAAALLSGREITVPAPLLAQVWRDGARQARLARFLQGCGIDPTSEDIAKGAGALLGRSGTSDAVDAIVVATARERGAAIVTSDPDDLRRLADALPAEGASVVVAAL